ncbi:glycosyl hydrolase [Microlunatus elymi]|uniref:Glycosyl hydrolase n=1 Tax=Microlunatus elymi TaxID=2596828 RepID=A0A516Q3S7_9ACTN|nr:glycoside hydrolase family 76 protein [Microlunatus elymi]QDP98070.1 glycosyl hydrolase [Microlunatus elymi]
MKHSVPISRPFSTSRRGALAGGLGLAAVAATGWQAAPSAHADGTTAPAHGRLPAHLIRAQQAYNALQKYFYDPDSHFYLEQYPYTDGNPWSYVWPFGQAMVATQVMSGIPGIGRRYRSDVDDRFRALEAYWNNQTDPPGYDSYLRPPAGQGGDKFYDDNEWLGLGFLLRHNLNGRGDRTALTKAEQIFDLVTYGWDTDASHPCPGGVFWTQASWSHDRNTVSNAPGAEIGLRLYLLTGKRSYLDWSLKMYDWVRSYLLAPNELYWDNVHMDGSIDRTQWSYNQGVMIGAGALLYRATGRRQYLDQARRTAAAALDFYAADEHYFDQPAEFNAIFFANLLQLSTIAPDRLYQKAIRWYADQSYQRYRDPATGLYRFDGDNPVTLLHQSAMVRIEGMLSWSPRDYRKLT